MKGALWWYVIVTPVLVLELMRTRLVCSEPRFRGVMRPRLAFQHRNLLRSVHLLTWAVLMVVVMAMAMAMAMAMPCVAFPGSAAEEASARTPTEEACQNRRTDQSAGTVDICNRPQHGVRCC